MTRTVAVVLGSIAGTACSQTSPPEWVEPVPGLRVNPSEGLVEIAGESCLVPDPEGRRLDFIELFVCSWDSREHESLVVTRVKPSDVHAALLVAGAEPGEPGGFAREDGALSRRAPRGSEIEVLFEWEHDGATRTATPWAWVRHVDDAEQRLLPPNGVPAFVFAGSRFVETPDGEPVYLADREGTLISLVIFDLSTRENRRVGVETIAWSDPISHELAIDDGVWVADPARLPPEGTPVTVRLRVVR